MKQIHTRRDKGRAVFLAALMVLSVFAMSVSFAGAAAASTHSGISAAATVDAAVADGSDEVTFEVQLVDDSTDPEPVAEEGVEISVDDAGSLGGISAGDTATTDENGVATFTATADAAGEYTVQFSEATTGDTANATVNFYDLVTDEDATDLTGGELVWQGESLISDGFAANSDVVLRDSDGDPVREITANDQGQISFSSDDLQGQYQLDGTAPDDSDVTVDFEVAVEDLSAEWDPETTEDASTLEISSDRGTYSVNIDSEDLDQAELRQIFDDNDAIILNTDDGIQVHQKGDVGLEADFSDVDADEYDFTVTSANTGVEDTATITVEEAEEGQSDFDENLYTEDRGDIVEFTVSLENTKEADVRIGGDDVNYQADMTVVDEDEDGEVTVRFNTYLAGQGQPGEAFTAIGDDEIDGVATEDPQNLSSYLDAADYEMATGVNLDQDEQGLATLVLNEGSTTGASSYVAPGAVDIENAEDVNETAVQSDNVADGDYLIFGVESSGIFGALDADAIQGMNIEIKQTNTGPNAPENSITNYDVIEDPEKNALAIVVDTSEVSVEPGEEYEMTYTLNENFAYIDNADNKESVSTTATVVEREASLDGVDDENHIEVPNDEEVTFEGDTTVAPGSELGLRLYSTEGAFINNYDAKVDEDGKWSATADLSDVEAGSEFDVFVRSGGENIADAEYSGTVVESHDHHTHEVTVTVEDENGDAVSGADVSSGDESATTDDDGKAVLNLAHGDHEISASYDGEEGDLKTTVSDDSPNKATVTLGQSNDDTKNDDKQDDNNDKKDDENKDNNNDNDGDDNNDDQPGSGADDDQPGFGIIVALIALLAAAGFALRRQ